MLVASSASFTGRSRFSRIWSMTRSILWAYSLLAWIFVLGTDSTDTVSYIYPNSPYAVSIQESDSLVVKSLGLRCGLAHTTKPGR
jgi:hypothetical protein